VGYPRKLLNPGEAIVLDLHPHWRIFLAPVALLAVGLAALWAVAVRVQPDEPLLTYAAGLPAALALLWLLWRWILWKTTHFVLTSDRVVYRSGVISKQGQNIPLERINNVAFTQSVGERLLRVGDIVIESAGETGRQTFSDVHNPSRVENTIVAEMEKAQARDDTRLGRATLSVADELAKLDDLRRQGLITEEEFAAQRSRLLG
jgi:uncharacterized membrane protein YdbT with pleckstrin-like domain